MPKIAKLKGFGKDFSSNKRLGICVGVSLFLHLLLLFSFYFQQKWEEYKKNRLISIEYKEEEKKEEKKEEEKKEEKKPEPETPKPQIATITMKEFLLQKPLEKINEEELKKLEKFARPLDEQIVDMKIDLNKMLDMHDQQVELDLNAFSEDLDLGDVPVLRVGKGATMDELLQSDRIMLPTDARNLPANVGMFAQPGFSGKGPGEDGIELSKGDGSVEASKEAASKSLTEKSKEKQEISQASTGPVKVEITGALADRNRIAWPLPPYPDWAQKQGLSACLSVQLKVDAEGKITGNTIVLMTTGYPDWDNGVVKWFKDHWRWEKIPSGDTQGCITIRFIIGQ